MLLSVFSLESLRTPAHLTFMQHSNASLAQVQLLDNPIWYALSTEQAHLAQGNTLAKRFPRDIAPFAGMIDPSPAAYQSLAEVLAGEAAALAFDAKPVLPDGWETQLSLEVYQMVLEAPIPGNSPPKTSRRC
jgi:hypothetical protein